MANFLYLSENMNLQKISKFSFRINRNPKDFISSLSTIQILSKPTASFIRRFAFFISIPKLETFCKYLAINLIQRYTINLIQIYFNTQRNFLCDEKERLFNNLFRILKIKWKKNSFKHQKMEILGKLTIF